MTTTPVERLSFLVRIIPPLLERIGEPEFSRKPAPGKWSKKEILGHLIDSAANNHHRFIRAQLEDDPVITTYDQEQWNRLSFHQQADAAQLIAFWTLYNRHLLQIITHMPAENMAKTVQRGNDVCTLAFLVDDYVAHLEHHLKQLVDY